MTSANWLLSGWIDVALVVGWLALVGAITAHVWRRGPAEPPSEEPSPVAKAAGWAVVASAFPALLRRRRR